MLVTKKNTEIFEAVSEVNGITVMTFKAEVDKENPAESSLDVKKESEQLYRQYRDQASADREQFQDRIFAMIDEYENPRSVQEECDKFVEMIDRQIPYVQKSCDEVIPGEWASIPSVFSPEKETAGSTVEVASTEVIDGEYVDAKEVI